MIRKYTISMMAAVAVLVPSCASLGDYGSVEPGAVGQATQVVPATVISAVSTTIKSENSTRNVGTMTGAALGAGAGQLLGGGSGRVASTVGFGLAGALAGRYIADSAGRTKAQRLTVRVDGSGETYSFVQPVYKNIGYISVGTHGNYHHGAGAHFMPDGM